MLCIFQASEETINNAIKALANENEKAEEVRAALQQLVADNEDILSIEVNSESITTISGL